MAKFNVSANDDDTIDIVNRDLSDDPKRPDLILAGRRIHRDVTVDAARAIVAELRAAGHEVRIAGSAKRLGMAS